MPKYTDAEIDYVIDALEFNDIRDQILKDPENIEKMMTTLNGTLARIRYHLKRMIGRLP